MVYGCEGAVGRNEDVVRNRDAIARVEYATAVDIGKTPDMQVPRSSSRFDLHEAVDHGSFAD